MVCGDLEAILRTVLNLPWQHAAGNSNVSDVPVCIAVYGIEYTKPDCGSPEKNIAKLAAL